MLQLVICRLGTTCWNKLQKACWNNQLATSLLKSCNKPVDNLQQTCCHKLSQAVRRANASWYRLVVASCYKMSTDLLQLARFLYSYYSTSQYTTLHYTTLHYTTLHYTTLHYTTLHYTTLHYTTLHYTTLHYTTLHCFALISCALLSFALLFSNLLNRVSQTFRNLLYCCNFECLNNMMNLMVHKHNWIEHWVKIIS